ncbi:hypothetical protein ACFFNY_08050 [Paenibacillus hodogayensis]|uniref:Uncharacterized protein n=1 Tax=Paenibacillus hodogayensis TaxID=279208 RepID=A0ABV5VT90_9BACL
MYRRKPARKAIAIVLTLMVFMSLLPNPFFGYVYAADDKKDLEVRFGAGTRIGNLSYEAENAFLNFYHNQTPGFVQTITSPHHRTGDWAGGDVLLGSTDQDGDETATVQFQIKVKDNPVLKALAQSGHAEILFGYNRIYYHSGGVWPFDWKRNSTIRFELNDQTRLYATTSGDEDDVGPGSGSAIINENSVIKITVTGGRRKDGESPTGASGVYIKFQDKTRPTLTGYTFDGNGAQRQNNAGQRELYVKQDENITLAFDFSEPVMTTAIDPQNSDYFLRHPLFVNPDGDGLPAAGQPQYLKNITFDANTLKTVHSSIAYQYKGVKYHHSGNNALEPKVFGPTTNVAPIDQSLEEKLRGAVLTDAAGNLADINWPATSFSRKASNASNIYLRGKSVDPFNPNAGLRVIVDAVAPKYSKGANGIQPEILTGSTVNNGDVILFTVQLSEETVVKNGYLLEDTFLKFNNGMKARYDSGAGTANWTFKMTVDPGVAVETPLLKVIALSNEAKLDDSDLYVIYDYAGNPLIQPADYEGIHRDGNETNINSKIDWAGLSIDNTPPVISYQYEAGGANDTTYLKNGKVTIDANDPPVMVPSLDPLTDLRGTLRPSNGIYRPSNVTGAGSPAVGLVYYTWTRSPGDPFQARTADQNAAVKRYSLSAKQPSQELYPDEFAGLNLSVANNKTNMIAPPPEALTEQGSGEWYLHTWTADMTWDTARERMQYEKMKTYKQNNAAQYEAWKLEKDGSDADKTFYADNKAMMAVGQYGDVNVWPLDDFKHDDSNWTYNRTVLKLDNSGPSILLAATSGDKTANVQATIQMTDEHSGLQNGWYAWVKAGSTPLAWNEAVLTGGLVTVSTLNEVAEDGQYSLYAKAVDFAGNERIVNLTEANPVTVDSTSHVKGRFTPIPNTGYTKSTDVVFHLSGLSSMSVTGVTYVTYATYGPNSLSGLTGTAPVVSYAFSASSVRPESASAYTVFQSWSDDPLTGERNYTIPADSSKNGIHYIHIQVKEANADRYYYFSIAYYFDNQPPAVTFSKQSVPYPQASHAVTVTVTEPYSTNGLRQRYQWVKGDAPPPSASSELWIDLPAGGLVVIDDKALLPGEIADFRLYVHAVDGAGNETLTATSGQFKVSRAGGKDDPPAQTTSDLIYLYGDADDGYTAIVKLGLDTIDKAGYAYSMSPDGGDSWAKWRPYTNFVAVKVPTGDVSKLNIQVKYKTPGGSMSAPQKLDVKAVSVEQPVYALAALSTTRPVHPTIGVGIDVTPPLGIKVVPSSVNPSVPVRSGNKFTVSENGTYSFDLTDTSDASRKDTLYVVVDNIDGIPPMASVSILNTAPTNGSVLVQLEPSEPVKVTNHEGPIYTFTENGSFTFQFLDEAGNSGTASVTVDNIRKEKPRAKIVRSYAYGELGSQTFGTIRDGNGSVLLSSGVTLAVEKEDPQAEDITVVGGQASVVLQQNGSVSFTVADRFGNTEVLREEVQTIVSALPEPEQITYTFVDESGNPLPEEQIATIDGKRYAKGKVKATIVGRTSAPNAVFSGTSAVEENGVYQNRISGPDGSYTYSRFYSANGSTAVALSDLLGNVTKVPLTIEGIDNKAPELVLGQATVAIAQNKPGFDFRTDLGGFRVSDNVSKPERIAVTISGLDLGKLGRQRVAYKAADEAGNVATVYQDVVVVGETGMSIMADGVLISASSGESALFDRNKLTFRVTGFDRMDVNGQERVNEWATYDLMYQSGLYREGQMKYIAERVSYQDLLNGQFAVTFPQTGWYTIIVRNQEREREYATFFIGRKE